MYCGTIIGLMVSIAPDEGNDFEIVKSVEIGFDFETQALTITTSICETCIRSGVLKEPPSPLLTEVRGMLGIL